jgi:hypothetical protein
MKMIIATVEDKDDDNENDDSDDSQGYLHKNVNLHISE